MLQKIRDRFTGVIAGAVIGVIAVALTITLVDTDTFTGVANFAARVNGEDIPVADFRQVAQQQILEQEELVRSALPQEVRQQLERNVLEGMVRNRVVAQYVKRMGYRVGDKRVAEHIRSLPAFQVGGQFSNDGYMAALASQGVSPDAFEEERRVALQIEELQDGLLESSFFTPAEFRRFVVLEGERRQASFAILDPQQNQSEVTVGEDDIKAYYDANPNKFESEESVALDYVEAGVADVPTVPEPAEADLRAAYEANPERFRSAEQRRARHILIAIDQDTDDASARKLATELRTRLGAGEDFAELARKFSDDPGSASAGGDLGWAGQGTYVAPFEAALYGQKLGEISDPVKTEFGYHIIQLAEMRPGAERSFEEARTELADEIRGSSAQDAFFALTEKMDDAALESPGTLEAVSAASGLPVRHVDRFTRAGGEPFGANRAIIDAVFSEGVLEDGENSALIEVGDGRVVVLRVTEHRPVKLRPLAEVRAEVESAVRRERAAKLIAERGGQIVEKLRAGGDFAALLAEQRATARGPVTLARNSEEVPTNLLAAIFRAPRPEGGRSVFDGLALPDGSFGVFRLEQVTPARPEDIPREQRDTRKSVLARQAGVAEVTALAVDLRKEAKVIVAPDLFEQQDGL
jgi:peptidyl-prolyl cis-trans isomerase D